VTCLSQAAQLPRKRQEPVLKDENHRKEGPLIEKKGLSRETRSTLPRKDKNRVEKKRT